MVRQCAWCLRLINSAGELISVMPLPKLYEASHGICSACGASWIEDVLVAENQQARNAPPPGEHPDLPVPPPVADIVLDLQRKAARVVRERSPRIKKGPLRLR